MTISDNEQAIKREVQSFYNQIGWKEVSEGIFQNARFEDLRPVSKEYIHRCHMRAGSFLAKTGRFFLDAGSGPIQYPDYLTYSDGYKYRVCLDISPVALIEARRRIGDRGLFIVADVSALPFGNEVFDGIISLHTLHHLPTRSQQAGYLELWRVLAIGRNAVIVNGWTDAPLMRRLEFLVKIMERIQHRKVLKGQQSSKMTKISPKESKENSVGTYVQKFTPAMLKGILGKRIPYEIRCWRSVSVRFLRAVIHPRLAGRTNLRLLFWLEDHFPHYFGVAGQYPLIVLKKPE